MADCKINYSPINYLTQEPVTVWNGQSSEQYTGNNTWSFATTGAPIPDGGAYTADKFQWLHSSYEKTITVGTAVLGIDDRIIDFNNVQYKFDLTAGTYKLIFEAIDPSGTWYSDRLTRYSSSSGYYGTPQYALRSSSGAVLSTVNFDRTKYQGQTFVHEEHEFTLATDRTIGLYFRGMGHADSTINGFMPRFMIVPTNTTTKKFDVTSNNVTYSGYSCWSGLYHSLRKLTTATEAIENPLYSDGTAITTYTLKGNEEHTGTPSPQNPVMPDGVGERTENLWNETYTGILSSSVTYFPIYVGSGDFTLSTTARKTESPNPSQNGNANIFFLTGNVSSGASTSGNGVWNGQNRTVTATDGYVTIAYRYLVDDSGSDPRDNDTMLNSGSTAKPYEPYGYKIPITSEGENLLDSSVLDTPYNITLNGIVNKDTQGLSRIANTTPIDVTNLTSVTLTYNYSTQTAINFIYATLDANNNLIKREAGHTSGDSIDVSTAAKLNICFYITDTPLSVNDISEVMLNSGSTAKPYSPYIHTTTPIYLGEVQSNRQIKKFVFDGTETNWQVASTTVGVRFNIPVPDVNESGVSNQKSYCSHLVLGTTSTTEGTYSISYAGGTVTRFVIKVDSTITTVTQFKQWLADQYAAGTPLTLWAILDTPTTGIVNEPLMKIGTYADTLSNAESIPTTEGANSITVDTTVQPSEFSATWSGWHNASVQEYTALLASNPLCGIDTYKDTLNLATGECTRRIVKIVYNGSTDGVWNKSSSGYNGFYISLPYHVDGTPVICNIAQYSADGELYRTAPWYCLTDWTFAISTDSTIIGGTTVEDWKAYLATLYANGTPLTIWHVTDTPTTETITVPSGLSGTEEGYLTQSETPTPTNPVYPTANEVDIWK